MCGCCVTSEFTFVIGCGAFVWCKSRRMFVLYVGLEGRIMLISFPTASNVFFVGLGGFTIGRVFNSFIRLRCIFFSISSIYSWLGGR